LVVLGRVGGLVLSDASTTVKGIVELATDAETISGTDAVRAVTPAGLSAALESHLQLGTTNSVAKMVTQYGIGKIRGVAVPIISEKVTFPVAFFSTPVVLATDFGGRSFGAFDPSGLAIISGTEIVSLTGTTTTKFVVRLSRTNNNNLNSNFDYYYSWSATGVLA